MISIITCLVVGVFCDVTQCVALFNCDLPIIIVKLSNREMMCSVTEPVSNDLYLASLTTVLVSAAADGGFFLNLFVVAYN
jgi:hypothetical protein